MTWYIIIGIITILLVGLISMILENSKNQKSFDFISQYRTKYIEFANKYRGENIFDNELYTWLTLNSNKAQNEIGAFGILDYTAPYNRVTINNYLFLINTIPKFATGEIHQSESVYFADCLLRYIGFITEKINTTLRGRYNPFIWFKTGIQEIFGIPILILRWFGVITNNTSSNIKQSRGYTIFSGIVSLIVFLAALTTIIQGKDETLELIKSLFNF